MAAAARWLTNRRHIHHHQPQPLPSKLVTKNGPRPKKSKIQYTKTYSGRQRTMVGKSTNWRLARFSKAQLTPSSASMASSPSSTYRITNNVVVWSVASTTKNL
ncbi:hypothetical protein CGMCC3_g5347 [Colletotrichum fructicola]|nr:uncharacterized protein CGMCC3_g5347 [Colletotrichum fructicola]KAE9578398.1 hypothetical protein CGMCC3_g5347 [Colletotrichum fructicola]